MSRRTLARLALALVCGVVGFAVARGRAGARRQAPIWANSSLAHVPHIRGMITLDGDTDDPGWKGPTLRTGEWVGGDGTPVHPHSEARVVWGDGYLYMNLYAADEDIQVRGKEPDSLSPEEDAFHVVFTDQDSERILDINPLGVVTDAIAQRGQTVDVSHPDRSWNSHVHVSHELDGTPNKPGDNDEEWVLEVAVPFESLGLEGKPGEKIGLSMHRCDTLRTGKRVCGSWGEVGPHQVLVLDPP